MLRLLPTKLLLAAVALIAAGTALSCGAEMADGALSGQSKQAPEFKQASIHLANHDLRAARGAYETIASDDHYSGRAHARANAGVALTSLLLLPGSGAVDEVLVNHLGAESPGLDAQRAIYAKDGYLDWLAQGVRWEGSGNYDGIKSLIADRVPWSGSRLDSFEAFVRGLKSTVDSARGDVLGVADRLGQIQAQLRGVLDAEKFEKPLVIPGATFHDRRLTLRLRHSELAAIASLVAAARGVIYYLAAYRYDWSLHQAVVDPCEAYQGQTGSGWQSHDCSRKFLDARWFRNSARTERMLLEESRSALESAFRFARRSITFGLDRRDEQVETTLNWRDIDAEYARQWKQLLGQFGSALSTETELSHTRAPDGSGPLRADFSPLFQNGGRTLSPSKEWYVPSDSSSREDPVWILSDRALQSFFVQGTFQPAIDLTAGEDPKFEKGFAGDKLSNNLENVFGKFSSSLEDAYQANR